MKRSIIILIIALILTNCQEKEKNNSPDVSQIPVNLKIHRFDKDFFGHQPSEFPSIRKKYAYIFPAGSPDSIWTKKMNDTLFLNLKKQVDSVFPDFNKESVELKKMFQHVKYYFPKFHEPEIVTIYSDWNYLNKVVYADSLMLIALDNFLGKNNPVYKGGVPDYIRLNLTQERIPVDAGLSIAETFVPPLHNKAFLYKMIHEGKKLYLLNAFLPEAKDSLLLGYSQKKYNWAKENEEEVWKYFISNKLLYESNPDLDRRFLNLAPYSKFYTEEDMNTPGQIGIYTGWQIVRSFMKNNDVSLQKMLLTPEEDLFKKSKYKPKK